MLEVRDLHVRYGDAPALWDVSLDVGAGEIVALIGPNGAGKTTLVNALAQLHPIAGGTVHLDGSPINGVHAKTLCRRGVVLIPEGRRLFGGMTVEENLKIGAYARDARAKCAVSLARVHALFPVLAERRRQLAGTLSGGQQQMVAIGRALMACPRLLLIDEPSLGLSPLVVSQVFEAIRAINDEGVAVLLIEQNVAKALESAGRAYVLEGGRIVAHGPAGELAAHPHIRQAYLGESGV